MAKTPTLDQWHHFGIRKVTLPSNLDFEVEVELASFEDLLMGDPDADIPPSIPNEFATLAARLEVEEVDTAKMTDEDRITFTRFRHWLVAKYTRSPKMTPKDVRRLPYVDQVRLFEVILHMDMRERRALASFRDLERDGALAVGGKASANGTKPADEGGL